MDKELYSVILSFLSILLMTAVVGTALGYVYSDTIKAKLLQYSYSLYLKIIAVIATISTAGALIYQFVYATPVCSLCWTQRIFMFPIEIIIIVSLYYKSKINHVLAGIMALIGIFFASIHYYQHVQKYVFRDISALPIPCSTSLLTESCANSPILTFGFITIPLMAVVAFLAIIWLSFLANKVVKPE